MSKMSDASMVDWPADSKARLTGKKKEVVVKKEEEDGDAGCCACLFACCAFCVYSAGCWLCCRLCCQDQEEEAPGKFGAGPKWQKPWYDRVDESKWGGMLCVWCFPCCFDRRYRCYPSKDPDHKRCNAVCWGAITAWVMVVWVVGAFCFLVTHAAVACDLKGLNVEVTSRTVEEDVGGFRFPNLQNCPAEGGANLFDALGVAVFRDPAQKSCRFADCVSCFWLWEAVYAVPTTLYLPVTFATASLLQTEGCYTSRGCVDFGLFLLTWGRVLFVFVLTGLWRVLCLGSNRGDPGNTRLLCEGVCCPCCAWAEQAAKLRVLTTGHAWSYLVLSAFVYMFWSLTRFTYPNYSCFANWVFGPVILIIWVVWCATRAMVRKHYSEHSKSGSQEGGAICLPLHCLAHFFCFQCAVVQEAGCEEDLLEQGLNKRERTAW